MSETRIFPSKPNGALHSPHGVAAEEKHLPQRDSAAAVRERPERLKEQRSKLAPSLAFEIQPSHGQMWPLHTVAWFYPELKPLVPAGSGLSIESSHIAIESPGFLRLEVTPANQSHGSDEVCEPLIPYLRSPIPPSGLEPSGWEPRATLLRPPASVPQHTPDPKEERGKR